MGGDRCLALNRERSLLLGSPSVRVVRNLRTGEPVNIRLKGKRRPADVQVLTDVGVVEHYAMLARGNHWFARFNKISLDQAGNPSPADLHLPWPRAPESFG